MSKMLERITNNKWGDEIVPEKLASVLEEMEKRIKALENRRYELGKFEPSQPIGSTCDDTPLTAPSINRKDELLFDSLNNGFEPQYIKPAEEESTPPIDKIADKITPEVIRKAAEASNQEQREAMKKFDNDWEVEFEKEFTEEEPDNYYSRKTVWKQPKGVPCHVKQFIRETLKKRDEEIVEWADKYTSDLISPKELKDFIKNK